jgi:hypothetical protein
MIKNLLLLISLFVPVLANCQTDKPVKKGNIILGGTGSITSSRFTESVGGDAYYKQFDINLNPTFNYFLIDNLAVGGTLNLGYSKIESSKSNKTGFGPNIKYYFNNGIFIRSEATYVITKSEREKSHSFSFNAGAGYAFFINSKVSVEPALLLNTTSGRFTVLATQVGGFTIPEATYDRKVRMFLFEIGFHIFL